MIISRAPFRVSFCGGGSDIPSFYEKYGGCVLSTSIRKYVYLAINKAFNKDSITLKYSKTEVVTDPDKIEHRIFRQVLKDFGTKGIEITSMADIPSGTGLGSSSSFTVALLKLLYTWTERSASTYKIAKEACDVEINETGQPDRQAGPVRRGLRRAQILRVLPRRLRQGRAGHHEARILPEAPEQPPDVLHRRRPGREPDPRQGDEEPRGRRGQDREHQEALRDDARAQRQARGQRRRRPRAGILAESWEIKKSLAQGISNPAIDAAYEKGMRAGATGGKLLGAGGGGFLLFYVPTEEAKKSVRAALSKGLTEMPFELDQAGCSIIFME
jgi:D-glycero-alpha-D-manno-heptose-7-phosphate kinase